MKSSINLVSKRRRSSAFHRRFYIYSVIFFSVMFIFSAGLIGYRFFLTNELNTLKEEETGLIEKINKDAVKKIKFLTVKERLAEVQKIINLRKNINNKIETISDTLPFEVGIKVIEGDEEKLVLKVTAKNLASLNSLIEEQIEEYAKERNRGVKRIEMKSFGLNPGSLLYEASFTIEFI